MSTCHASSIVFDGRTLSWFGPEGASWNVPVDRLHAIRERVAQAGDVRWWVEFEIDGEDAALQSPANANGMDRALAALSARLRAKLELQLERAAVGSSRVLWLRMPEMTTEVLQAFADAWNRHDIDALMSFMTDDCAFEASAGPDVCGTRYAGREAVRAGFTEVWKTFPDAHWGHARHFVAGDRGVSEWTFTGTRADGTRVEVHGCDLFTFRDGKIALKNSYRKNRPPVADPKH